MILPLFNRLENIYSDAMVLWGLCELADRIGRESPEWDISALLSAMAELSGRVAESLDNANLRKVAEA